MPTKPRRSSLPWFVIHSSSPNNMHMRLTPPTFPSSSKVSSKMLEVQIILHDRLRSAYYALAMATMDYLHNMADLQEEVLRTVGVFHHLLHSATLASC